jgi:hypothetical protein
MNLIHLIVIVITLEQCKKMEIPGIEPGASYMRSMRSTTELYPLTNCPDKIEIINRDFQLQLDWTNLSNKGSISVKASFEDVLDIEIIV